MILYHYFEKEIGPFKNLSDLSDEKANEILDDIKKNKKESFLAKRSSSYMKDRRYYEEILKREFIKKGGKVEKNSPNYMIIGESKWLESWYINPSHIEIDIDNLDKDYISFTYGDSHPTFSDKIKDQKEYRKKVYTYDEILKIIEKYGLPQNWNSNGEFGPERYIEVHIWTDKGIK